MLSDSLIDLLSNFIDDPAGNTKADTVRECLRMCWDKIDTIIKRPRGFSLLEIKNELERAAKAWDFAAGVLEKRYGYSIIRQGYFKLFIAGRMDAGVSEQLNLDPSWAIPPAKAVL